MAKFIAISVVFGCHEVASAQRIRWDWLRKDVWDRIQITGRRALGYHSHQVEGDRDAFDTLTYGGYGDEKFTDLGILNITGRKVLGVLDFDATLDPSEFRDPQTQKITLNYQRKGYAISAGDIQGSALNTNRFASFSKSLRGVMLDSRVGRFRFRGVTSETKGSAKTLSIQGNNTVGPYYLAVNQIVRGSEEVRLDGETQQLGIDYIINYEVGTITFLNKSIPPTSSIVVSFEALGFNENPGQIFAGGVAYNIGSFGEVGVTMMKQKSSSSGSLSQRKELFEASGSTATPYPLQFTPLNTKPITVKVNEILAIEGVDYYFDSGNPAIFYFKTLLVPGSTISVVYTPIPTQTADGDRNVFGFDYRLPLGRGGSAGFIKYSQATGELDNAVSPLKGTAKGIEGRYKFGKLELFGGVRDVPRNYVNIETRGFNRNEKATDMGLNYDNGPVSLRSNSYNSSIVLRKVAGDGSVSFSNARSTSWRNTASFTPRKGLPVNLIFNRTRSRNAGNASELDSIGITTSKFFKNLETRFGIQHQTGRGPVTNLSGTTISDLKIDGLNFEARYNPNSYLSVAGKLGLSKVDNGEESGTGEDFGLSVNYRPSSRLNVTLSNTTSNSGELANLGQFQNGDGLGYGGNGFSGGVSNSFGTIGASNLRLWNLDVRYNMSERIAATLRAMDMFSEGSLSANSHTQTLSGRLDADLGKGHFLGFGFTRIDTTYGDADQKAGSTLLDLSMNGDPAGRFAYSFGLNFLISSGNNSFKQDSSSIGGSLSYFLKRRHYIIADFQFGKTSGLIGQEDRFVSLAHQYQIWGNVALRTSYTWRDLKNSSDSSSAGAFKSSGFDIELTINFIPR